MNKALEQKLIGPMEESHTKQQSPKAVLWMELWARRSKIAAKRARTRAWAEWGFFWVEDEVCGCWHKWRGATRGPRDRGRALHSRGLVLAPPVGFSVPKILKYSIKIILNLQGIWSTFIFGLFFIARINQKKGWYYFCFIYFKRQKVKKKIQKVVPSSLIHLMIIKMNPLTRLIKSC